MVLPFGVSSKPSEFSLHDFGLAHLFEHYMHLFVIMCIIKVIMRTYRPHMCIYTFNYTRLLKNMRTYFKIKCIYEYP